jgi:hypothetical protein
VGLRLKDPDRLLLGVRECYLIIGIPEPFVVSFARNSGSFRRSGDDASPTVSGEKCPLFNAKPQVSSFLGRNLSWPGAPPGALQTGLPEQRVCNAETPTTLGTGTFLLNSPGKIAWKAMPPAAADLPRGSRHANAESV